VRFAIRKRRPVSEALSHALEQIDDRLVRGLKEAERELAETRERCDRLEEDVRLIRAALEPSVLGSDALLAIPPATPEPGVAERLVFQPVFAEAIVTVPDVAEPEVVEPEEPEPEAVEPEEPEPEPEPVEPEAEAVSADPADEGAAPGEEPTEFAQYMPMLEELWEIANRDQ
jgi:hypothetical protein